VLRRVVKALVQTAVFGRFVADFWSFGLFALPPIRTFQLINICCRVDEIWCLSQYFEYDKYTLKRVGTKKHIFQSRLFSA